jgi:hypothetical protein
LLSVVTIVGFLGGALLGALAAACAGVAISDRPTRRVRQTALVGLATGTLALAGAVVLTILWVAGV